MSASFLAFLSLRRTRIFNGRRVLFRVLRALEKTRARDGIFLFRCIRVGLLQRIPSHGVKFTNVPLGFISWITFRCFRKSRWWKNCSKFAMFYFCGLNAALRECVTLTIVYHIILHERFNVGTVELRC